MNPKIELTKPHYEIYVPPKPVGALYLLPDFCVHSHGPKPEQKHLNAMFETFGFVWKDLP